MTWIIAAILLGLVSSFHCLGMCGPIALILPVNKSTIVSKIVGILLYNFGRIVSYSMLGLLIGVFGEGLRFAGISQIISIVLGVLILIYVLFSKNIIRIKFPNAAYLKFNNYVKNKLGKHLKISSNGALFVTGLLNGLIPCGVVFIALQASLLQTNIINSTLFMLVCGLGTVPMMFGITFLSNSIGSKGRYKINKVLPFLTVIVALLLIVRGMNLNIPLISPSYNVEKNELSCCHKPQQ